MDRTTRFVLIAGLLGASLVASGAVGRASMTEASGVKAGIAEVSMTSAPVPYFPAQYQLNAPAGTSEPISTF